MYQVTFSEQAMRELNRLDKLAQLDAIEPISSPLQRQMLRATRSSMPTVSPPSTLVGPTLNPPSGVPSWWRMWRSAGATSRRG